MPVHETWLLNGDEISSHNNYYTCTTHGQPRVVECLRGSVATLATHLQHSRDDVDCCRQRGERVKHILFSKKKVKQSSAKSFYTVPSQESWYGLW